MSPVSMKTYLSKRLPTSLRVPVRYYYNKILGTLEPEMSYLKDLVGNGERAIDIGANTGLYTYALSKLFRSVEAFEPIPWLFEETSAYVKPNIKFYNIGLSDHEDILDLHIPIINGKPSAAQASFRSDLNNFNSISVPVKRLDNYHFTDVSLIKIDVEGYESEVISGAIDTIERCRPNLLVEIEQRHLKSKSIDDIFHSIIQLGYTGKFIHKSRYMDLSHFSYDEHQKPFIREVETYGTCKGYVNNFIFCPSA